MISTLISEATVCDFKEALEVKKPKSWLKSVSAFANTAGGTLFFGVDNAHNVVGLSDPQTDAENISRLIKERISPIPRFILTTEQEYGKAVLVLSIPKGTHTPYYYKADGIREAYIRLGDESIVAPDHILHELILDGMNESFDSLISKYDAKDYAFTKLRERYKVWTGNSFDDKYFFSFGLVEEETGKLTNAGVLFADVCPLRQSRLFCVRWNGLTKAGGLMDAFDSSEFTGSIIKLLEDGMSFIKRNTKMMWRKAPTSRIELPEYADRSCLEALVNALVHRSYLELGSEVHIDIFDDRMTIYSPGGMADGSIIQNQKLNEVSSKRRNPVLADVFSRLGYMERQGSGLEKIIEWYQVCANYTEEKMPTFSSTSSQFIVTLPNLNYGIKTGVSAENQVFNDKKTGVSAENQVDESKKSGDSFTLDTESLPFNSQTKRNIEILFNHFSEGFAFSRKDIKELCNLTDSPAGDLINKMKKANLITEAKDKGRGKYKFLMLQDQ